MQATPAMTTINLTKSHLTGKYKGLLNSKQLTMSHNKNEIGIDVPLVNFVDYHV